MSGDKRGGLVDNQVINCSANQIQGQDSSHVDNVVFLSFRASNFSSKTDGKYAPLSSPVIILADRVKDQIKQELEQIPTYVSLDDVDLCQVASTQYIIEQQIKDLLGPSSSQRLDVYATFEDLSLDFVVLFGLKKKLNALFKVSLNDVEFSLYSCIATLADHVLDQVNRAKSTENNSGLDAVHAGSSEDQMVDCAHSVCEKKESKVVSIFLARQRLSS